MENAPYKAPWIIESKTRADRYYKIHRTSDPTYPYNVQEYDMRPDGTGYYYCGIGRFCRTITDINTWTEKRDAE